MPHRGFITLHRKLVDWEWYTDIPTKTLFIHIILNANHEPKRWRGIAVDRGEFITGRLELAKNTGLSQQEIRTAIKKLRLTNEITTKSTNKFTIIKLESYRLYQSKKTKSNQQATNNQPTINQQSTTTNNENNDNHLNNENTPLPPKNDNNVNNSVDNLKKEEFLKKWEGGRKIVDHLPEPDRMKAKKNAPQWCLNHLADIYFEGIQSGTREPPDNLNAAFPAWCSKYTKGKPPQH